MEEFRVKTKIVLGQDWAQHLSGRNPLKLRSALHARSHASMKLTPISIRTRTFIFTLPRVLFQRTDLLRALL